MYKKIKPLFFCLIIVCLLLLHTNAFAGGLSTGWGEIIIENLEIGKTYELNKIANFPFEIKNDFDHEVTIKVEILKPMNKELKKNSLPLEDTSWVNIDKQEFIIEPLDKGRIDLILSIPDKEKYKGKKYQFWVWSYTVGKAVGVGLKSRIIITIRE